MKKFSTPLLSLMLLLGTYAAFGQNYTWTHEPSLALPRYAPASFAIGNEVYVISGITDLVPGGVYYPATMSHEVWAYNTVTNTWTQKANYPGTAVYASKGFSIGTYGYVVNGWDSTGSGQGPNTTWQYNSTNDTWAQKANFPGSTRYTAGTFAVSGKGYVTCGFSPYVNDTYCYDPATDTWTQKANFPGGPRQDISTFVLGNYAYAGMGSTSDGRGSYFLESDWYKYDPSSDTWTLMSPFPGNALSGTATFTVNGEGYIINGLNQNSVYFNSTISANNQVWKYTPGSDSWSLWGIFPDTASYDGTSTSCNGAGYLGFGGYTFGAEVLSRDFYRFGPSVGPFSCNITLSKYEISNAVYNFQANGSFSPTAQITWNFGDGGTGVGTSVIHNYTTVGNYNVTVSINDTASSCNNSATDSVSVTNINTCSVSINNVHYDTLYTLSTVVTSGAGPYTYQWSCSSDSSFSSSSPDPFVGVHMNTPTTYCVTVTDTTGCVASACTTLVDSQAFTSPCQIYLVVYPDSAVPGAYYGILYIPGGSNLTYLWDFGDGTTSTNPFPSHTYATPGRYTICLTVSNGNGCTFTFCDSSFYAFKYGGGPMNQFNVRRQVALGVNEIQNSDIVGIFPNPATSQLTIMAPGIKVDNAIIYNTAGQSVMSVKSPAENQVNIGNLANGIYFMEIKVKESTTMVKFVKAN